MFTDGPVTPLHVESVISFLRANPKRKFTREDLRNSFQPPSVTDKQTQSNDAIKASMELGLMKEDNEKQMGLTSQAKGKSEVSLLLRQALDKYVLAKTDLEDYLARFYSYTLGLNENAFGKSREDWVIGFNRDVFGGKDMANQFNTTKLTGLHRWMTYMGLGWYDQKSEFQCNPYERISRNLKGIFGEQNKLECDEFIESLAKYCPELDCGKIFLEANKRYDRDAKQCTLGLSHALIDLHLDGQIKLHCPIDSNGWSIGLAIPPKDGKTLMSDRISQVEIGKGVAK